MRLQSYKPFTLNPWSLESLNPVFNGAGIKKP
jgi:hypothetical protein